ncbi:Long-chain-fatty-acid--CoA ligase [compost metagenome]
MVGIPHKALGEVPVAFVIQKPGVVLDVERILAHCREHLSGYKVPYAVEPVTDIPRTGSGKVLRFKLREKFLEAGNR